VTRTLYIKPPNPEQAFTPGGLHDTVPWVAPLVGLHFRVTGFIVIFGHAENRNQCGLQHSLCLEQLTMLDQQVLDGGQDRVGKLELFRPMTRTWGFHDKTHVTAHVTV
jgi:hypothetical protein